MPKNSQRGFTLIEVTISVALLAMGSLAVYSIWGSILNRAVVRDIQSRALILAQERLTEASIVRYSALGMASGSQDEFTWTLTTSNLPGTSSLSGFQWEPVEYVVNVSFTYRGNANTINLTAVRLTRIP